MPRSDQFGRLLKAGIGSIAYCVGNSLKLAAIDLDRGNIIGALQTLEACRITAEHLQDRRRLGEFYRLFARMAACAVI